MSLTSGLFSGVSGLSALGNAMTVIGDNIANVNTVGFKESRVTFQDVLSQTVATTSGSAQVGRGTALSEISSSFAQGSFESTNSSTDLAIGGTGFFIVRDPGNVNNEFYSRAGEFRFDKDGDFINPSGYIARGWALDETTGQNTGTITDITLSSFTSSPAETNLVTMIMNLDSGAVNSSTSGPPTGITAAGVSVVTPGLINITAAGHNYVNGDIVTISGVVGVAPVTETNTYTFAPVAAGGTVILAGMTMTATGAGGATAADIATAFANRATSNGAVITGTASNNWTYSNSGGGVLLVTSTTANSNVADLGGTTGTVVVTPVPVVQGRGGTEVNGTWEVINASPGVGFDLRDSTFVAGDVYGISLASAANLPNTALSSVWNGVPAPGDPFLVDTASVYQTTVKVYDSIGSTHDVTVFFDKGVTTGTNPVWEYIVTINPSEDTRTILPANDANTGLLARGTIQFSAASGEMMNITCAENNGDGTWTNLTNADATASGGYFSVPAAFIEGAPTADLDLNFGSRCLDSTNWTSNALSTTQYASASTTVFQSADGYGAGDLQAVTVSTDGVITGQYSNGQVLPLYRVGLAKFQNEQGLYKVGGNLFQETLLSGAAITGVPGTNGLGSISPNSLEQSNVDLATEFVKMITTQRGYQANSKIITTIDQMLAEIIQLKR